MSTAPTLPIAAATKATLVSLRAVRGKGDELAELLAIGRDIVAQTEPGTLYWVALRSESDPHEFAIFDLFADASGRAAHFEGQVAAALQSRASELVEGGWEQGVLPRVVHYDMHAAT